MEERGTVKKVEGSRALVEVKRSALCEGCHAKGSCTLGDNHGLRLVWTDNPVSAKEGDTVILGIEDLRVIKGSFIFYIVPVFSLFLGAAVGKFVAGVEAVKTAVEGLAGAVLSGLIADADNLSIVFGVLFLLLSFLGIWFYSRRASGSGEFRPRIIRTVTET